MSIMEPTMDLSGYSDDELADVAGDVIREAHRRADALEIGPTRRRIRAALRLAHLALEQAKRVLVDEGTIQPFSGGDPKPEPGE